MRHAGGLNTLLPLTFRTPSAHRTPSTDSSGRHLPVDPAQRQLHQRGRADRRPRSGVPYRLRHHVRPAARGQGGAQDRPPDTRYGVRDQRAAHAAAGGGHRGAWAATAGSYQVRG